MRSPTTLRQSNGNIKASPTPSAPSPTRQLPFSTPSLSPAPPLPSSPLKKNARKASMISPPKKSKQLTFNLADVNRPPSHVEMSIRATYGLALGNPTQPRVDALKNLSVVPLSSTQLGEMKEREEAAREAPRMAGRVPGRDELESVHGPVRAIDRQIATRTTRQKVVKRNILDSDSDSASDDESLGSDPSDIADSAPETHDLPVQEELVDPLTAFLKAHLGPSTDSQIYVNATVRAAALTQLHAQANAAAARTIQSAYRSWTSKQLVLGWVSFSQMSLSDPTKQSTAKEKKHVFVPPPNAFQERLSTRAYKRLQSRQLRMILHTWHTLVASFKRIRLRILVCHTARKMSRKIVGWQRVVVRQMALKSVVYIQERVVRMRHFRLWRGLTIIKRNMFWCMRRALHAMKHYICGAAVEVRDRWEVSTSEHTSERTSERTSECTSSAWRPAKERPVHNAPLSTRQPLCSHAYI